MTDEEKIAKLKNENQKLTKEFEQAEEEIKFIEKKKEKKMFESNNMEDNKRE